MSKDCERCGKTFWKRYRESAAQWEARRYCCSQCVWPSLDERLWSQIDKGNDDECWPWTGHVNSSGHGGIKVGRAERGVHRVVYEQLQGPVPAHLILHHECGNPRCCNPAHLTVMAQSEHVKLHDAGGYNRQRTHCINGHEFSEENTHVANGFRYCRTCRREAMRRHRQRKKAAA